MSETETRDWQSEAGRLEHLLRLSEDDRRAMRDEAEDERDRHARELARLRTEADTLRRTVARYKGDRDDAWARCAAEECDCVESVQAELSRLRDVVEAVQALGNKAQRDTDEANATYDPITKRYSQLRAIVLVDDLRAALAPVSSSGETESSVETVLRVAADAVSEAESGEALDRVTGKPPTAYTPPEDVTYRCRSCGHLTVNEPPRTCAVCEAVAPAPIPSGGQADGEGRCEHGIPLPEPARAAERVLTYVRAKGDGLCDTTVDDEPLYGRDLESVAKAVLAARPVLSREDER